MADMKQILPQGNVVVPGVPDFYNGSDLRYTPGKKTDKSGLYEARLALWIEETTPDAEDPTTRKAKNFFYPEGMSKEDKLKTLEMSNDLYAEFGDKLDPLNKYSVPGSVNYQNFSQSVDEVAQYLQGLYGIDQDKADEIKYKLMTGASKNLGKGAANFEQMEIRKDVDLTAKAYSAIGNEAGAAYLYVDNSAYFTPEEMDKRLGEFAEKRDIRVTTDLFETQVIAPVVNAAFQNYETILEENDKADETIFAVPDPFANIDLYLSEMVAKRDVEGSDFKKFSNLIAEAFDEGYAMTKEEAEVLGLDPIFFEKFVKAGLTSKDADNTAMEIIEAYRGKIEARRKAFNEASLMNLATDTVNVHAIYSKTVETGIPSQEYNDALFNIRRDIYRRVNEGELYEPATHYILGMIVDALQKNNAETSKVEWEYQSLVEIDKKFWSEIKNGGTLETFKAWMDKQNIVNMPGDGPNVGLHPAAKMKYFNYVSFLDSHKELMDIATKAMAAGADPGVVKAAADKYFTNHYNNRSMSVSENAALSFQGDIQAHVLDTQGNDKAWRKFTYDDVLKSGATVVPYTPYSNHVGSVAGPLDKLFSPGKPGAPGGAIYNIGTKEIVSALINAPDPTERFGAEQAANWMNVAGAFSGYRFNTVTPEGVMITNLPLGPTTKQKIMMPNREIVDSTVAKVGRFEVYPAKPGEKNATIVYVGEGLVYKTESDQGAVFYKTAFIDKSLGGDILAIESSGDEQLFLNSDIMDHISRSNISLPDNFALPGGAQDTWIMQMLEGLEEGKTYEEFIYDLGLATKPTTPLGIDLSPMQWANAQFANLWPDKTQEEIVEGFKTEALFRRSDIGVMKKDTMFKVLKEFGITDPQQNDILKYIALSMPAFINKDHFTPSSKDVTKRMDVLRTNLSALGISKDRADAFVSALMTNQTYYEYFNAIKKRVN
jgi:hypothetical protein